MRSPCVRGIAGVAALILTWSGVAVCGIAGPVPAWEPVVTTGKPHARHEAAFVECDSLLYLIGGRGIKPVDIFDPATSTWTEGAQPPVEIHHFQPVVWEHRIYFAGAMTGKYPHETPLDHILIYDPKKNEWSQGAEIPVERRRGGAGAAIRGTRLYLVCGIQNGHWDGWVSWLDAFDLNTGIWEKLPDAPRPRDHFQAAFIGDNLYAAGGRKTSGVIKQVFDLTIPEVDVFDAGKSEWSTLPAPQGNIPTPRAGCFACVLDGQLLIGGGESTTQKEAHNQVEALDPATGTWHLYSRFAVGRHGTGIAQWKDWLYTAAGSGGRGGGPELNTAERLRVKP